jgi:transposase InsO family protein
VPKNIWWALSPEKTARVMVLYKEFPEIATHYVLGVKAGMSPSSAGRILNRNIPQEIEVVGEIREEKTCDWLKLHACWSIDTIKYLTVEGWLYIQMLLEEYSRAELGWLASMSNTADRAVQLAEKAVEILGVKPLILKFDRGSEFKNAELKSLLAKKEIQGMASPRHYPGFNGKRERGNQLIEKFLPEKGGISIAETYEHLERGAHCINHELPRIIFKGKTSAQIYAEGEIYAESERETLKNMILKHQAEIELIKKPRWDKLDVERKSVVKSVVEMGLLKLTTRMVNANQLQVVNV